MGTHAHPLPPLVRRFQGTVGPRPAHSSRRRTPVPPATWPRWCPVSRRASLGTKAQASLGLPLRVSLAALPRARVSRGPPLRGSLGPLPRGSLAPLPRGRRARRALLRGSLGVPRRVRVSPGAPRRARASRGRRARAGGAPGRVPGSSPDCLRSSSSSSSGPPACSLCLRSDRRAREHRMALAPSGRPRPAHGTRPRRRPGLRLGQRRRSRQPSRSRSRNTSRDWRVRAGGGVLWSGTWLKEGTLIIPVIPTSTAGGFQLSKSGRARLKKKMRDGKGQN